MKNKFFLLSSLSLILSSCVVSNEGNSSISSKEDSLEPTSSEPNAGNNDSSSSEENSNYTPYVPTPEKDEVTVDEEIILTKEDVIDLTPSSFIKNGAEFSLSNIASNPNGFVSLNRGGCITNLTPFSKNIASINVSFTSDIDYGSLVTKTSAFAITSPMNGAYEITTSEEYSYLTNGKYFSLYSPLGGDNIESITIKFDDKEVSKNKSKTIDFYTINDTHGAADENVDSSSNTYQAGIKKLSGFLMNEERRAPEEVVALCSGDMWQGGMQSNYTRGKSMVDWMNVAGFESMAIGNHEFDWKAENIEENSKLADFPFLAINITDPSGNRPSWAKPSKVISRGGVRIGVVGAIGNVASSISVSSLGGYSFNWSETTKMVESEAKRLRIEEGCDLVVLSLHYSTGESFLASTYWGEIDAVFEGHTHKSYSFVDSYGIPHVQTYGNGSNFRNVSFKFDESKQKYVYDSDRNIDVNTITGSYSDEPMASKVYNHYEEMVSSMKKEVVYSTTSVIDASELADFAVKCLYEYYSKLYQGERKFVGAVVNGGCARQSLTGDITYADIIRALPFENENVYCNIPLGYLQRMASDSYYSAYISDVSNISSRENVEVVMVSFISDKASSQNQYHFVTEERDGTKFLYDIVADAFREGKYGR